MDDRNLTNSSLSPNLYKAGRVEKFRPKTFGAGGAPYERNFKCDFDARFRQRSVLVRPTSNFPSKSSISNSNVSSEYTRDRRGSFANTWLPCARRRGYEKFGFVDVYYYAEERFGFSPRKTRYLLQLGQNLEKLPQLKKALEEGKLGWTKASRVALGDIVRAMGADFVIAVDVGEALKSRDELRSVLEQASQSLTIMIQHGSTHGLDDADIIIRPDLQNIGATDWRKGDAIADLGAVAAAAHASELMKLALGEEDWQAHRDEIEERERSRDLTPEFVEVVGAGPEGSEAISRRLQDFIGTPLDTDDLDFALTALTGTNRYESLSYESAQEDEDRGLLVRAKEKEHGPPFINFSLRLSNQAEEILFDFGARFTAYDVGRYGAEVRIDGALGTTLGLAAEYYRPIGNTRLFVAPRGLLF